VTWYAYLLPGGYSGVTPSPLSSSFSLKKTKKESAEVGHWVPRYVLFCTGIAASFQGEAVGVIAGGPRCHGQLTCTRPLGRERREEWRRCVEVSISSGHKRR
jgi:hypothetical protein